MRLKFFKWLLVGMSGLLAACAIITVNVYFPEKAVKEAYKSLDDMLLKDGAEKTNKVSFDKQGRKGCAGGMNRSMTDRCWR